MNPIIEQHLALRTRRYFLGQASSGLGALALSNILGNQSAPAAETLASHLPHFAPKAKRVIYLHMTGSPPNLDLFDYKPKLVELNGQDAPDSVLKGKEFAFTTGGSKTAGHIP